LASLIRLDILRLDCTNRRIDPQRLQKTNDLGTDALVGAQIAE